MATHSSILSWGIPWTEEPGGVKSMGSQRVRRAWAPKHTCTWEASEGDRHPPFSETQAQPLWHSWLCWWNPGGGHAPETCSRGWQGFGKMLKILSLKKRLPREILRWGIRPHQLLVMYVCSLSLVLFPLVFFMWNMREELDILHNFSWASNSLTTRFLKNLWGIFSHSCDKGNCLCKLGWGSVLKHSVYLSVCQRAHVDKP